MPIIREPYSHPARLWVNPDTRRQECLACGEPVTGEGSSLRHEYEAVRQIIPAREDVAAVSAAVDVATRALESMITDRVTDRDRARVIVESLYCEGALRTGHSKWRRPALRRVA